MPFDFEAVCKNARGTIAVPDFPLAKIRSGALRTNGDPRKRRGIVAALLLAGSMAAIAAAAVVANTHVVFTPSGGLVLSSRDLTVRDHVTAGDLATAARNADFAVTLPAGLPEGSKLMKMTVGSKSVIALQYDLPGRQRASRHMLTLFLVNPAAISGNPSHFGHRSKTIRYARASHVEFWRVGGEEVIAVADAAAMTSAEFAAIHAAMQKAAGQ